MGSIQYPAQGNGQGLDHSIVPEGLFLPTHKIGFLAALFSRRVHSSVQRGSLLLPKVPGACLGQLPIFQGALRKA